MSVAITEYSAVGGHPNHSRSRFVSIGKSQRVDLFDSRRTRISYSPSRHDDAWLDIAKVIATIVASAFQVSVAAVHAPNRGCASVASARQVALYLAHVGLSFTLTQTGHLFGRDRTTVAHACRAVEERREDPQFDACLDYLEIVSLILIESRVLSDHENG